MIDFHSHILPGIDDGSKNTDMSIEMLAKSASYGIDTMVATPHFYITSGSVNRFIEKRSNAYDALINAVDEKAKLNPSFKAPCIIPGAEVYYFNGISRFDELERLKIKNTNYILLEMPFTKWNTRILEETECLISERGFGIVIAHIERYMDANKGTTYINDLLSLDVKIQSNGEFFNSFFTKRKAVDLLNKGIINLLGSDCHNLESRAPNLDKTFSLIEKKLGKSVLSDIDSLGRKILGING